MSAYKFSFIFKKKKKKKMAAIQLFQGQKDPINLEILQVASSNLPKRYMARKASVILIWGYPMKRFNMYPMALSLLLGVCKCENN